MVGVHKGFKIWTKHGFACSYARQGYEVHVKTKGEARGLQNFARDLENVKAIGLAKIIELKLYIFSYPSALTYVLGVQKNHLVEYPQHIVWLRNKNI